MRQTPCGIHRAMEVRRLAWAGLEVKAAGQTAVVDLVEDFSRLHGDNPPAEEMPPSPTPATAVAGLLTHLHSDHADVDALGRALAPTAVVLRPERSYGSKAEVALIEKPESALEMSGLATRVVKPWETVEIGPFSFTALPAADGFGDPQVSWCIAADGCRILHAGDTLFHGWWWLSALRQGPFDVAFLPVGGAVVDLPSRQPPSPLPAGMGPRQAAVAAKLLGARTVVPIHYGPLHEASNYVQSDDPPGSLCTAAAELGIEARVLRPGEQFSVQSQQKPMR
jgi:L-ascorbate metabolism protein UlaG (beta-lactamase superfamily)